MVLLDIPVAIVRVRLKTEVQISVVTACCNSASTLEHALDSVASQNYSDIEHIVIDGASSDGTCDILEGRPQGQLNWHSEPDEGIYDALNKGIARAQGDVLASCTPMMCTPALTF